MTPGPDASPDDGLPSDDAHCPCSSGDVFGGCCGPILDGSKLAPTAERLMRSRYSAFVLENEEHLLVTWHPTKRPADIDFDPDLRWRRLVVLDREAGGPFDDRGVVEFSAHWVQGAERGVLHERSRFVRENKRWLYLDGELL